MTLLPRVGTHSNERGNLAHPGFSCALLVAPGEVEGIRVRQVLLRCGVGRVLVAQEQAEAMRLLNQEPIQLILVPWELPGFSARALLRALKKGGRHKKIPMLILDSGLAPAAMVAAVKAGAAGRVGLPPKTAQIAASLQALRGDWPCPP